MTSQSIFFCIKPHLLWGFLRFLYFKVASISYSIPYTICNLGKKKKKKEEEVVLSAHLGLREYIFIDYLD